MKNKKMRKETFFVTKKYKCLEKNKIKLFSERNFAVP